jgi:uncharacterized protein with HEPN domain
MFSERGIENLKAIKERLDFIERIVEIKGSTRSALDDEIVYRAAILMHIAVIAEQFDKLSKNGDIDILSKFSKDDVKGIYDIRTYIAHNYGSVDTDIVENAIDINFPILRNHTAEAIASNENDEEPVFKTKL